VSSTSERVQRWAGAHENYILKNVNGSTQLIVDMDITEGFKEMFPKMWPVALDNVKRLSEKLIRENSNFCSS